ncbi:MAG: hypothetical protein KAS71_11275 [Bacteroidales bacterium]|nr:hypothetical protein [Bacteroidales bacterium]
MKKSTKDNLVYRIIEYAYNNEVFDFNDLKKDLNLSPQEELTVRDRFVVTGEISTPNHLLVRDHNFNKLGKLTKRYEERALRALPSAIFHYIEFVELQEARKTAKQSFWIAWIAIFFSLIFGSLQVVIALGWF